MQKLVPGMVVAALMALGAPAGATTLGNSGLLAALQDLSAVDQVHCRPGWQHHAPTNIRRRDGCLRQGAVIVPPVVVVPRVQAWCHRRPWSGGNVPC